MQMKTKLNHERIHTFRKEKERKSFIILFSNIRNHLILTKLDAVFNFLLDRGRFAPVQNRTVLRKALLALWCLNMELLILLSTEYNTDCYKGVILIVQQSFFSNFFPSFQKEPSFYEIVQVRINLLTRGVFLLSLIAMRTSPPSMKLHKYMCMEVFPQKCNLIG